jgi:hypothetical protein
MIKKAKMKQIHLNLEKVGILKESMRPRDQPKNLPNSKHRRMKGYLMILMKNLKINSI